MAGSAKERSIETDAEREARARKRARNVTKHGATERARRKALAAKAKARAAEIAELRKALDIPEPLDVSAEIRRIERNERQRLAREQKLRAAGTTYRRRAKGEGVKMRGEVSIEERERESVARAAFNQTNAAKIASYMNGE